MIYLLSPRRGGPFKQLKLVADKLAAAGYQTKHCYRFAEWANLHFNSRDTIISVIPFLFLRNKKKFILNIRGNYHKEKRISNPLSYLYTSNVKLADKIILPSKYLKKELSLPQAVIIPNSIDTDTHPPALPAPGGRNTPVKIVTVTNFDFPQKARGVNKLINIINRLNTARLLEFHIYGSGQWLKSAKQQYKLHNIKKCRVFFHGHSNNIHRALSDKHIFVYWSTFDNMPNTLIEALACGLPIVANKYGAYQEILGTKNLLASDKQQFSQHLLALINNPKRRQRFSRKNLKRSRLFDINKNIAYWIKAIES